MTIYQAVQEARGTAALWTSTNPVPLSGQWCLETDTGKLKMGDGVTSWTSLGYYSPGGFTVWASGDTSGVTDQAAITATENAATVYGGIITFRAANGTNVFWVTGLVKQPNVTWQGQGRLSTVIKLAAGSNADVVQGAGFGALTLSGSTTGGISGWGIRDLAIDGNKSAQSGTSYGLRFFGYSFDLSHVSIRNCLTDGMYSEWGSFGDPLPDKAPFSHVSDLIIHDCGGNGWHDRGPHDSRAYDVTIFNNGGSGSYGYWPESNSGGISVTVAAGSAGVSVSTFAGAGTLNVSTTLGYPAASISSTQGSLTVSGLAGGTGSAVITYTGKTAAAFTGCTTVSGSGTLAAGSPVTAAGGGYGPDGSSRFGMHCYTELGLPTADWQYIIDSTIYFVGCTFEVGGIGSALIRGPGVHIVPGTVFNARPSGSPSGIGIQLGDTVNPAYQAYIRAFASGYANTGTATASLAVVNDSGENNVDLSVYAAAGTTAVTGTPSPLSYYNVIAMANASAAVNAANSLVSIPVMPGTAEPLAPQSPGAGEAIFLRALAQSYAVSPASGTMLLTYWTASTTGTATTVQLLTGATAASGLTHALIGVYSVDAAGNLTLISSSANLSSTLFAGAFTGYTVPIGPFLRLPGRRYALGVLCVGTGMPALAGAGGPAYLFAGANPAVTGQVPGLTALPASVAAASVAPASAGLVEAIVAP